MKIFCEFPTINISKLNFWLVICIAKNFIWTTLKAIFSIFWLYLNQILSYPNKPYINGKRFIYSAFRWCINLNFKKLTFMTGFVVQGHRAAVCHMTSMTSKPPLHSRPLNKWVHDAPGSDVSEVWLSHRCSSREHPEWIPRRTALWDGSGTSRLCSDTPAPLRSYECLFHTHQCLKPHTGHCSYHTCKLQLCYLLLLLRRSHVNGWYMPARFIEIKPKYGFLNHKGCDLSK